MAVRRSGSLKPVSAAAWVRPCSKAIQVGVRNGRIAMAITTIDAAAAVAIAASRSGTVRAPLACAVTAAW